MHSKIKNLKKLIGNQPNPEASLHRDGELSRSAEDLLSELQRLRARLRETEEVVRAIGGGEVDALVVAGRDEDRPEVFTLVGVDDPYRKLVEAMQEGAVMLATDGTLLYVNPSFCRLTRKDALELVGTPFADLIGNKYRALFDAYLNRDDDARIEVCLRGNKGAMIPVYLSRSAAGMVGEQGISVVVTDLTEQRAHLEVVESERLAHSILEQAAEAIIVCDAEGVVTHASGRAQALFEGNLLLTRLSETMPLRIANRQSGAGGEVFIQTLSRGEEAASGVDAIFEAPGGGRLHLHLSSAPLRSDDGRRLGAVLILADVTASREAAEALAESEIRLRGLNETLEERVMSRTQALNASTSVLEAKNKELQEFAYVASHDLQEPLRKIGFFTDLLKEDLGEALTEDARFYIERIQNAGGRMSELLQALLSFSRVSTRAHPLKPCDLNVILEEVLSDLDVALAESEGRVETDTLPTIDADPMQMRQLLQNLIGNGLKFARSGVAPVVKLRATRHEDEEGIPWCRIEVADNGIGFDEKYLDRIFSPFQRLHGKSKFPGAGMGLAICRRIAERHNGTIAGFSSPGEGARFVVDLPCKASGAEPA